MKNEIFFPTVIWKEIISYLPIKKRFTFDENNECELHKIFKNKYYKAIFLDFLSIQILKKYIFAMDIIGSRLC